jgi:nitroimidazol reductase NimA-like FMN-containing flavoprotein (pyridoxamine 5'-phosphate oxidase superfamily)
MPISEMSEADCRAVLAHASVARLGCSRDGQPYVVPVYIALDGRYIYVFSTFGKKIKWMRENPKVCLQADNIRSRSHWSSVIAYGRYEELNESEYAEEREHGRKLLEKRHKWFLNAIAVRRIDLAEWVSPLFFRIEIDSLTGLAATDDEEG